MSVIVHLQKVSGCAAGIPPAAAMAIRWAAIRSACAPTCSKAGSRSGRRAMSYGVVFTGAIEDDSLAVDMAATAARRGELAAARKIAAE
jgi:hypothetical protein